MKTIMEKNLAPEMGAIAVKLLRAYLECSEELQACVREMVSIVDAADSSEDERQMAIHTIAEILFPEHPEGSISLEDLDQEAATHQPDGQAALAELDAQEQTFAERLGELMRVKGIKQAELAERAGVGQPAISMMLSRNCRPQRKTVNKLAAALEVEPGELWAE